MAKFEAHYNYDTSYMRDILEVSPGSFQQFEQFMPISQYREKAKDELFFLGKIAAMQSEDCGTCLQLAVTMALEAGVEREIVQAALNGGEGLPPELRDVYRFSVAVASKKQEDNGLTKQLEQRYGRAVIAELALCVATNRVYPTLKRALGYAKSCSLISIDI